MNARQYDEIWLPEMLKSCNSSLVKLTSLKKLKFEILWDLIITYW